MSYPFHFQAACKYSCHWVDIFSYNYFTCDSSVTPEVLAFQESRMSFYFFLEPRLTVPSNNEEKKPKPSTKSVPVDK